ncbi:M10 family metallopeptidase C-terminal domain-containing protein [Rhizobium sp. LjRoot254]|uniref:M10 family metallopeptidase C-terminal domain-containing protein n=1 Tax=Rhizobium sp. LjRoot254 TaxID=3342297 RepID=UPI003ECC8658
MLNWNEISGKKAYSEERAGLLVLLEGSTLTPYVDSVGDPTIGIGFNLVYNLEPVLRVIVGARNWSDTLLRRLEAEVDKNYAPNTNSTLIANLNKVMSDWHNKRDSDVPSTFSFRNEAQVAKALDALAPTYDSKVDKWLSGIPDSEERTALFSLCWNGPSLLGPKLKAAIEGGNRAEAWYEIRYNSNGNGITGLANRRYVEAETFGLFDTDNRASFQEAIKTGQMLANHHQAILSYEDRYDPLAAGEIKGVAGIEAIGEEIAPAIRTALRTIGLAVKTHVEELLAADTGKLNIAGDGTTYDSAKNDDDLILGGKGQNMLSGNAGADILAGLKGADILTGGVGADVFAFSTIKDSAANACDVVADFGTGADRIALGGLGDLDFLGKRNAGFSGHGLEVRWFWDGQDTVVEADIDGDRAADLKIVLTGRLTLTETDFLL